MTTTSNPADAADCDSLRTRASLVTSLVTSIATLKGLTLCVPRQRREPRRLLLLAPTRNARLPHSLVLLSPSQRQPPDRSQVEQPHVPAPAGRIPALRYRKKRPVRRQPAPAGPRRQAEHQRPLIRTTSVATMLDARAPTIPEHKARRVRWQPHSASHRSRAFLRSGSGASGPLRVRLLRGVGRCRRSQGARLGANPRSGQLRVSSGYPAMRQVRRRRSRKVAASWQGPANLDEKLLCWPRSAQPRRHCDSPHVRPIALTLGSPQRRRSPRGTAHVANLRLRIAWVELMAKP